MEVGNNKHLAWYPAARGTAVVSGAFSLVVACLLVLNHLADSPGPPGEGPLYSGVLAEKKLLLSQNTRNEELKDEVRSLDLEVRQAFFRRKTISHRGKSLLLVGVALLILALRRAAAIQETPPMPELVEADPDIETRGLMEARKAVGVLGLALLGGVLALVSMPRVELTLASAGIEGSATPGPDYPSREEIQKNWPMFRGPAGTGVSTHERVPTSWDGESGEGIQWKTEIPLPGHNSPIVWEDRVFVSGADEKHKEVYCYAADSGELLWQRRVENVPGNSGEEPEIFEETGYAASTMACDGARVYAIFVDGDLVCFDVDGRRLWAKNMGMPDSVYSFATSLVLYRDLLLIQYDQGGVDDGESVLYALEAKTGAIAWRTARPVANTWTSPILIDTGEEEQIITCSEPWAIAYDPGTGQELWRADVLGPDLAPSAVYAQGMVFVIKPNEALTALRTDGRGDVTDTHVAWMLDFPAPDICSPVTNGELIFLLSTPGTLTCCDAQSGDVCWEHEFEDSFQASPSLAGGWVYLLSEEGNTYRVKADRKFEESGTSRLDEWITASPAFVDGRMFIRGDLNLYCIGDG